MKGFSLSELLPFAWVVGFKVIIVVFEGCHSIVGRVSNTFPSWGVKVGSVGLGD